MAERGLALVVHVPAVVVFDLRVPCPPCFEIPAVTCSSSAQSIRLYSSIRVVSRWRSSERRHT